MMGDGTDVFIVVDGVKIAKCGHPNTPQDKTWISIEPGWIVQDYGGGPEGDGIRVTYNEVRVH
jgi:hypothetical protein